MTEEALRRELALVSENLDELRKGQVAVRETIAGFRATLTGVKEELTATKKQNSEAIASIHCALAENKELRAAVMSHRELCDVRHRHDTDEQRAVTDTTGRISIIETRQARLDEKLQKLEQKDEFHSNEISQVVSLQSIEEAKRAQRDAYIKLGLKVLGLVGGGAACTELLRWILG